MNDSFNKPETVILTVPGVPAFCRVIIGAADVVACLPGSPPGRLFLVSDRTVFSHLGGKLVTRLESAGWRVVIGLIPPGEKVKSFYQLRRLALLAHEAHLERNSPVIALGGGVVTDLAGFFAATYLRGLPLVNIPTTLLGQVDAAIGGKNGINLAGTKNQVGTFYQPAAVICDPGTLESLPAREYRAGLAEIIKCGIIRDRALFDLLENGIDPLSRREPAVLKTAITRAVKVKCAVVTADAAESRGVREILNFGHTLGHGLETAGGNRKLNHGEAVALGMAGETEIAAGMGLIGREDRRRIISLLAAAGLPRRAPGIDPDAARRALAFDKKNSGGTPAFVLPSAIGATTFRRDVPETLIRRALKNITAR